MAPMAHAELAGTAYTEAVVVTGAGEHTTPSNPLNVQIAEYLNLTVNTTGAGAGDTDDIVIYLEGKGVQGRWNTGRPIPIAFPVFGTTATDSAEVIDVRAYQEVRVGKIANPNSGAVTVNVYGDFKA